jgi:uncharacterized protein YebE (UPF0316 family)
MDPVVKKSEKQVQSRKVKWNEHILKCISPFNNTILGISSSLKAIILHIHGFGIVTIIGVDLKEVQLGDLALNIIHRGFDIHMMMWLRIQEHGIKGHGQILPCFKPEP